MNSGEKLKKLRKTHGYTQEDLAKKMNVSKSTITKWETSRRNIMTEDLIKLSELFNVSIDYLLGNTTITEDFNTMTLGKKLKILRGKKGLSQRELATILNLKQRTYASYETDTSEPTIPTLILLADYFEVTLDDLMCRNSPPVVKAEKTVIYLSGAITGNLNYKKQFDEAEKGLKTKGYIVLNPASLPTGLAEYEDYMAICLSMLSVADGVYLLKGWEDSKGATRERDQAIKDGKLIFEQV